MGLSARTIIAFDFLVAIGLVPVRQIGMFETLEEVLVHKVVIALWMVAR